MGIRKFLKEINPVSERGGTYPLYFCEFFYVLPTCPLLSARNVLKPKGLTTSCATAEVPPPLPHSSPFPPPFPLRTCEAGVGFIEPLGLVTIGCSLLNFYTNILLHEYKSKKDRLGNIFFCFMSLFAFSC